MPMYAKSAAILCLLFCSACSNDLFSKQWRITHQYCQSGGDHLAVDDNLKTSRVLFWKSLMANRADSTKNWKLTNIDYDAWTGNIFGGAVINHEECFMFEPYRDDENKKAVRIFMLQTSGAKCDSNLVDAQNIAKILAGNCPGTHSGGWRANQ